MTTTNYQSHRISAATALEHVSLLQLRYVDAVRSSLRMIFSCPQILRKCMFVNMAFVIPIFDLLKILMFFFKCCGICFQTQYAAVVSGI